MTEATRQSQPAPTQFTEPVKLSDPDDWTRIVDSFEDVWQTGTPPQLDDFLPPDSGHAGTDREWSVVELLRELVKIDLEYNWKRCRELPADSDRPVAMPLGPLIEEYMARYSQLSTADTVFVEMIGEEYRVRQQWGDRPTLHQFVERFPGHAVALQQLFAEIDRELAVEHAALDWAAETDGLPTKDRACLPRDLRATRSGGNGDHSPVKSVGPGRTRFHAWPTQARRTTRWEQVTEWVKRRHAVLLIVASFILTGLAAGAVVVNARLRAELERSETQPRRLDETNGSPTLKAR